MACNKGREMPSLKRLRSVCAHVSPARAGAEEQRTAVWVYGSLRRGFKNFYLMRTAQFVGFADLYIGPDDAFCLASSVPLDWHAAPDTPGGAVVHGETYLVDESTLAALDKLEGYRQPGSDDVYDRQLRALARPQLGSDEPEHMTQFVSDALVYLIRRADAAAAGKHIAGVGASSPTAPKKKVAVIATSYFPGSHADVIVSKFLQGFPTDEGLLAPRTQVVSMYIDQIHASMLH